MAEIRLGYLIPFTATPPSLLHCCHFHLCYEWDDVLYVLRSCFLPLLQADNRDLVQPSAAPLRGLISRGLGFGLSAVAGMAGMAGVTKQQPKTKDVSEYDTVLIFVVGGISATEIREVRQELAEHQFGHQPKVIVGGTSLLAPVDAARLLLAPSMGHA